MTPIDRNPDIDTDTETVPPGLQLIPGKNLMQIARSKSIPFGVATKKAYAGKTTRRETIGLIIRDADAKRFKAAVRAKSSHRAKGATNGKES